MVRGCRPGTVGGDGFVHLTPLGDLYRRCPKAWAREDAAREAETLRQVDHLTRYGVLPRAGGLDDQSPTFVSALDVVELATRSAQAEMREIEAKRGSA